MPESPLRYLPVPFTHSVTHIYIHHCLLHKIQSPSSHLSSLPQPSQTHQQTTQIIIQNIKLHLISRSRAKQCSIYNTHKYSLLYLTGKPVAGEGEQLQTSTKLSPIHELCTLAPTLLGSDSNALPVLISCTFHHWSNACLLHYSFYLSSYLI